MKGRKYSNTTIIDLDRFKTHRQTNKNIYSQTDSETEKLAPLRTRRWPWAHQRPPRPPRQWRAPCRPRIAAPGPGSQTQSKLHHGDRVRQGAKDSGVEGDNREVTTPMESTDSPSSFRHRRSVHTETRANLVLLRNSFQIALVPERGEWGKT